MRKDGGDSMICMQDMNMLLSYEYVELDQNLHRSCTFTIHFWPSVLCWVGKVELVSVNLFALGVLFYWARKRMHIS